ncbi:nucleotide exchange factor GrpE [Streptomyces canarius]
MTEETPGFEEKPDVPSGATSDDAEPKAAPEEGAAPAGDGHAENAGLVAQLDQVRTALSERTADLQRLQAEYQNYRRRVERDRIAQGDRHREPPDRAPAGARRHRPRAEHGELLGGFKSVAESLETVAAKMGLQLRQGGPALRPDDPRGPDAQLRAGRHRTTCVAILQPGYRIGERTIRPARVAVAEPQPGAQTVKAEGAEETPAADDKENGGPDEG